MDNECTPESLPVSDGNFICKHPSNDNFNVKCECHRQAGYYGDPLDCKHIAQPCGIGLELKCDGTCKPCDEGYIKNYSNGSYNLCDKISKLSSLQPAGSDVFTNTFVQTTTTTTTTQVSTVSPGNESQTTLIMGICGGISLLVLLIGILVGCYVYKKRKESQNHGNDSEQQNFETGQQNISNGWQQSAIITHSSGNGMTLRSTGTSQTPGTDSETFETFRQNISNGWHQSASITHSSENGMTLSSTETSQTPGTNSETLETDRKNISNGWHQLDQANTIDETENVESRPTETSQTPEAEQSHHLADRSRRYPDIRLSGSHLRLNSLLNSS